MRKLQKKKKKKMYAPPVIFIFPSSTHEMQRKKNYIKMKVKYFNVEIASWSNSRVALINFIQWQLYTHTYIC